MSHRPHIDVNQVAAYLDWPSIALRRPTAPCAILRAEPHMTALLNAIAASDNSREPLMAMPTAAELTTIPTTALGWNLGDNPSSYQVRLDEPARCAEHELGGVGRVVNVGISNTGTAMHGNDALMTWDAWYEVEF